MNNLVHQAKKEDLFMSVFGNTSILQHYADITDIITGTHRHLESVATAVLVVSPAGHAEYPSATAHDLRLELANASGQPITDDPLDFNVTVTCAQDSHTLTVQGVCSAASRSPERRPAQAVVAWAGG